MNRPPSRWRARHSAIAAMVNFGLVYVVEDTVAISSQLGPAPDLPVAKKTGVGEEPLLFGFGDEFEAQRHAADKVIRVCIPLHPDSVHAVHVGLSNDVHVEPLPGLVALWSALREADTC